MDKAISGAARDSTGPRNRATILFVDDSAVDFSIYRRAWERDCADYRLFHCDSITEARDLLAPADDQGEQEIAACAILLDLSLPGESGQDFLAERRDQPRLRRIPVIVLTETSDPRVRGQCYELGANAFFTKSATIDGARAQLRQMKRRWFQSPIGD